MALSIKLYRQKMSVRIFVLSTIFIASLCITLFSFFIYNQMASLRERLVREGTLLIDLLAYNSRLGVFSENEKLLNNSVEAMSKRKNVFLVSFFNAKGEMIVKKYVNMDKSTIPLMNIDNGKVYDAVTKLPDGVTSINVETRESFEFWAPVYPTLDNDKPDTELVGAFTTQQTNSLIGYVHLSMGKKDLKNEQHALMYKSGALGVIFSIIGLMGAYLVVKTITNPINELTKSVRNFGITGKIKITSLHLEDEIGELANSFNEMGGLVQKRTDELNSTVVTLQNEVAQRKKSEDAVMELNMTLDRRVREEIHKQREQEKLLIQQSRLSSMGEMISIIAHQWRQPLSALSIISVDLQDAYEYGELNKEYFHNSMQKSNEQIQFMSKTIDDFRDFFKPDREKEQCSIIEVVNEAMSIVESQLRYNDIYYTLTCRIHGDTFKNTASSSLPDASYPSLEPCNELSANIYRNEFKQVILIIVSNSKDAILESRKNKLVAATPEGAESESPQQIGIINIDFAKEDGKAIIRINDNGGGISGEIIDRIYEPYFTTKFKSKGTGIGLYMAKVIIENNMNGSIYTENIPNGARFTIELSCDPEAEGVAQ